MLKEQKHESFWVFSFPLLFCVSGFAFFFSMKIGFIVGNFPDAMHNRTPDVHCIEKLQMSKHYSKVA